MAITRVQLGSGSWIRNRADEPRIDLINRFFEANPTNLEEQAALIERPALIEYATTGEGAGRRLYTEPGFSDGDLFHVAGDELWKHHMNTNRTVTTTQISGFVDGTGTPDIVATDTYLWITDGYELQYTDGSSALTPIATPDGIPMISLDVFNGYVLCVQADSDRFYWIEPGAITIDALNFATAERFPDKILQVRVVGDEFWLLGEKSIEVWRATGSDPPFERLPGRAYNFGIFGGTAVRMKDTSVIMVAHDGTAISVAGTPNQIGNPAIAERLRNAIKTAKDNNLD